MGAVFSLPCFRRQRRRRCTSSALPTRTPTRTVAISHPRPLSSVVSSGTSVHGGGPSTVRAGGTISSRSGGVSGGSGARTGRARSTTASTSQQDKDTDKQQRGFIGIGGFSHLITLGMNDGGSSQTAALDLAGTSRTSSEDTHTSSNTSDTGVASGSSGSTTLVDTLSPLASDGTYLLRGPSQATSRSCCSDGSHCYATRSTTARRSPTHKRTNSYNRTRTRSGRPRPRSYPAGHYGDDESRQMSPTARRRKLRKIHRVDNGWDVIRSADLDGFDPKLGRNGNNRIRILG